MKLLKRNTYTDQEVVMGLQARDERVERWFYDEANSYFNAHFSQLFFDKTRQEEIFEDAFVRLWTEITNRRIRVNGELLERLDCKGFCKPLNCKLTTFLMGIARNTYREATRERGKEVLTEDFTDDMFFKVEPDANAFVEDVEETKIRIVDECIAEMSPSCIEILTLFYYKGKSLDEIMAMRADSCSSKNGLKSAKHKCMTTLKTRIAEQFSRLNIK